MQRIMIQRTGAGLRSVITLASTRAHSTGAQANKKYTLVYGRQCSPHAHEYVTVYGPDTVKFLNGLVTAKLLPTFVKKNLTTISEGDSSSLGAQGQKHAHEDTASLAKHTLFDEIYGTHGNTLGAHTCFLNSQGKLVADCVLYSPVHPRKHTEVTLGFQGHSAAAKSTILQMMATHKLLSKVKVHSRDRHHFQTWEVAVSCNASQESLQIDPDTALSTEYFAQSQRIINDVFNTQADSAGGGLAVHSVYLDRQFEMLNDTYNFEPRVTVFKVLTTGGGGGDEHALPKILNTGNVALDKENWSEGSAEVASHFDQLKLNSGIYTNSAANTHKTSNKGIYTYLPSEKYLPLDLSYDLIPNSISFDKGCYIGQELTTRMHTTNKISKRLVPVDIQVANSQQLEQLAQWDQDTIDIFTDTPIEKKTVLDGASPFASSPFQTTSNTTDQQNIKRRKKVKPVGKIIYIDPSSLPSTSTTLQQTPHILKAFSLINIDYVNEEYGLEDEDTQEVADQRKFYAKIPTPSLDSSNTVQVTLKPSYWLSYL